MFGDLLVDLYGGRFNIRGNIRTVGWVVKNKWKDDYKDGWWTPDDWKIQVVVDGTIPHGELKMFDHRGEEMFTIDFNPVWKKKGIQV